MGFEIALSAEHAHAPLAHCFHVRPAGDQRDVGARRAEHRTDIRPDGARSDDSESHRAPRLTTV
jgi:hypothetical protein